MIELTREQASAVAAQKKPVQLLDPQTKQVYVLIRQDIYKLTGKVLRKWDDPGDDDLIEAPNAACLATAASDGRRQTTVTNAWTPRRRRYDNYGPEKQARMPMS